VEEERPLLDGKTRRDVVVELAMQGLSDQQQGAAAVGAAALPDPAQMGSRSLNLLTSTVAEIRAWNLQQR
jgi:hypothetical protein